MHVIPSTWVYQQEKNQDLNWIHLRNFNLIKRMTGGDKGRMVFNTIMHFYLHNTDTPMPMCWYVLVEKKPVQSVLCRRGHQYHTYLLGTEQRRQKSHSVLQEREQMVQKFTHTNSHLELRKDSITGGAAWWNKGPAETLQPWTEHGVRHTHTLRDIGSSL